MRYIKGGIFLSDTREVKWKKNEKERRYKLIKKKKKGRLKMKMKIKDRQPRRSDNNTLENNDKE